MNVYDFDKTIYAGDSSLEFYLYCIKEQPSLLKYIPKQILGILFYKLHFITKTKMKEQFFSYLKDMRNIDEMIDEFWVLNYHKINIWYMKQKKEDDIIISASPEFLLLPICQTLNIKSLIASKVDKYSGKFLSENCYGKMKPIFFRQRFPDAVVDAFYSDSLTDQPMARLAEKPYFIKNGIPVKWTMEENK